MIKGNLTMEDHELEFELVEDIVHYTVRDTHNGIDETLEAPMHKFFKALAIAVHADGMPDAEKDYPDAESIQGAIRWIP